MLEQFRMWDVSIGCLSETCVAWNIPVAETVVKTVTTKFDQNAYWNVSTSTTTSASLYKPGGTGTYVSGDWSGKIVEKGQDAMNMGRWNHFTIQGKNNKKLTIITGYRCGADNINNKGSTTAYFQ